MPRIKPIVASTPEELAAALGLSAAEAKQWQVQQVLLKRLKEIVCAGKASPTRRLQNGQALREPE